MQSTLCHQTVHRKLGGTWSTGERQCEQLVQHTCLHKGVKSKARPAGT